mmetsp:Transcript_29310/g.79333  ORF Transcript_29310/g.79333 Transcript_29310/m.79333 type:complete len:203 (-) Transcript_29310:299-907(-)
MGGHVCSLGAVQRKRGRLQCSTKTQRRREKSRSLVEQSTPDSIECWTATGSRSGKKAHRARRGLGYSRSTMGRYVLPLAPIQGTRGQLQCSIQPQRKWSQSRNVVEQPAQGQEIRKARIAKTKTAGEYQCRLEPQESLGRCVCIAEAVQTKRRQLRRALSAQGRRSKPRELVGQAARKQKEWTTRAQTRKTAGEDWSRVESA